MGDEFQKNYFHVLYENSGSLDFDLEYYKQFLNNCRKIKKQNPLIDIPNNLNTFTKEQQILNGLGISLDKIVYIFNSKEFSVYVDELIQGLYTTYLNFYKNKNIVLFYLNDVLNAIFHTDVFKQSQFFQNYLIANNNEYTPLILLVGSYLYKYKFQKISDTIKKSLISLSNNK